MLQLMATLSVFSTDVSQRLRSRMANDNGDVNMFYVLIGVGIVAILGLALLTFGQGLWTWLQGQINTLVGRT